MVKRDGATTRGERIQKIVKEILKLLEKSENDEISVSKTIALLEYEIGLTPEKIRQYLEVGEKMERFVIEEENDKIVSMKKVYSDG